MDDEDRTHFDSGLVVGGGAFPSRIDIDVSIHGRYCFNTIIDLHASPLNEVAKLL